MTTVPFAPHPTTEGFVTRFAPSPNGDLHLGHVLSAITGHEMARRRDGRFLVRIEDIDVARTREAHVASILDDLAWIGLTWEQPVLRQSHHFRDYAEAARRLRHMGLLYPCFATRGEIIQAVAAEVARGRGWTSDPDGAPLYPGLSRAIGADEAAERIRLGEPHAWRLDMEKALVECRRRLSGEPLTFVEIDAEGREAVVPACPERWGDAVIVRKDIPASYHLAVVIDDARQGVTVVTRGRDLYAATDLHRLLQVLLGLAEPRYHHHRLLLGADGRKLSKSAGSMSLRSLRQGGMTAAEVCQEIGIERLGVTGLRR
ncbi:MAG: tRNA glutamyl-Q(34) synthetase GluQRS [Hyphomicrobiaceae bacterium]|nr:tRNA glutamyl-Q(34) synthetase GluQRS [Hyphomicrobiaceae bacterium]